MTMTPAADTSVSVIAYIREKRRPLPPRARRREIREQAGLSRGDVAAVLGVSPTAVAWWERENGFEPRAKVRAAYLKLLGDLEAEIASWASGDKDGQTQK